MPPLTCILETGLYVEDVERAAAFYERVFGFPRLICNDRICALAVAESQVLLLLRKGGSTEPMTLPNGDVLPPHDGTGQQHFAFGIEVSQLDAWRQRLTECGVEIISTVRWELGGVSLYFHDPDGHVAELATRGTWRVY